MKYSKEKAAAICELFATGEHKIADVCKATGITESTFHKWKAEKSEFSESLKKAEASRLAQFATLARSGLAKLLDVYEVEETTTEYVDSKGEDGKSKPKIKGRKVTVRKFMPNATAVIFALKNLDSENFKDKQEMEHTGGLAMTWNETRTYGEPNDSDPKAN
jgi:transposase-like protein